MINSCVNEIKQKNIRSLPGGKPVSKLISAVRTLIRGYTVEMAFLYARLTIQTASGEIFLVVV
jgi:hypothetical protein